jgi:Flp pilus assembly pilin Flp
MAHSEAVPGTRSEGWLRNLVRNDEGQDVVEYGLLAALISIAAVLTIQLIGPLVDAMYQQVLAVLQTA